MIMSPDIAPRGHAVEDLNCNGLSRLLWENASPNSNFGGGDIVIDTSRYNFFVIFAKNDRTLTAENAYLIGKSISGEQTMRANYLDGINTAIKSYFRSLVIDDGKITFDEIGVYYFANGMTKNAQFMIPTKIYGIR